MKKLQILAVPLLIVLVLLIGMAGACGNGEETSPTPPAEEKGVAMPEAEEEPVKPEEEEEAVVPEEKEEAPAPAPPTPGEWTASTEFGELGFTVTPDSKGISKISLSFPGKFSCGGITVSGGGASVEGASPWPITDGRFTIDTSISMGPVIIEGSFDESGKHASGTWEINVCSGDWESP